MNYIITNNRSFFEKIGDYNYCNLEDMVLPKNLAVDTETTSKYPRKGEMFAVQIGTGENNYLIDLQPIRKHLTFKDVAPYLHGKNMVLHNVVFDVGWFYKYNFWPENVYDTMIASMLLHNGDSSKRHSFKAVMERELGIVYDKTEQKNIHKVKLSTAPAIEYCFNDVDRLLELMKVMARKMEKYGVIEAFKLNSQYTRALAYMEQCGLPVNKDKWLAKTAGDKADFMDSRQKVIDYIHDHLPQYRSMQMNALFDNKEVILNLNSPKQMIPVFEDLGIDVTTDDDKKSIKEDVIQKSAHEFVPIWLDYKRNQKTLSTYGVNVLKQIEDGKLYSNFNPLLETARISTRKGSFPCLVIPAKKTTRECFEAPEGYKLIVCDFDQQENVVGTDLHRDPVMLKSITEGLDLHCAFARLIFPEIADLSDEEIKEKHSSKRSFSKAPRFAIAYGGTGYTIAKNANLPTEEGDRIYEMFLKLHPNIKEWGEAVLQDAIEKGYIESADGFKLKLPYYNDFMELHHWFEDCSKAFWGDYRQGKLQYQAQKVKNKLFDLESEFGFDSAEVFDFKLENSDLLDVEYDEAMLEFYKENRQKVQQYFKKLSAYSRLCLNNPIQSTAAFQTKRAAVMLFDTIVKNNHQWDVQISNIPHDEIILMVKEELANQYREILQQCMRDGGNYYLKSGLLKIGATANVGNNWYEAK